MDSYNIEPYTSNETIILEGGPMDGQTRVVQAGMKAISFGLHREPSFSVIDTYQWGGIFLRQPRHDVINDGYEVVMTRVFQHQGQQVHDTTPTSLMDVIRNIFVHVNPRVVIQSNDQ